MRHAFGFEPQLLSELLSIGAARIAVTVANPRKHCIGGVAERSNAAVLKTAEGASSPWVRIPPPPRSGAISTRPIEARRSQLYVAREGSREARVAIDVAILCLGRPLKSRAKHLVKSCGSLPLHGRRDMRVGV